MHKHSLKRAVAKVAHYFDLSLFQFINLNLYYQFITMVTPENRFSSIPLSSSNEKFADLPKSMIRLKLEDTSESHILQSQQN
jgi:hypothetical protein